MPLPTAEIYAKLGTEEGQLLYPLALHSEETWALLGYKATLPEGVDGEEVATEHDRVLYAFTSAEKAQEVAKKTSWHGVDLTYPEAAFDCSD